MPPKSTNNIRNQEEGILNFFQGVLREGSSPSNVYIT